MVNRPRSGLLSGSAAFAAMGVAGVVHADTRTIYVDASRPPSGDGQSWATAFSDLQVALNQLSFFSVDQIRGQDIVFKLAQGTFRPAQQRDDAFRCGAAAGSAASITIAGSYGGFGTPSPELQDYVATPTILSADVNGDDGPDFANRGDNCQTVLSPREYGGGLPPTRSFVIDGLVLMGGYAIASQRPSAFYAATNTVQDSRDPYQVTSYSLRHCEIRNNFGSAIASDWYETNIVYVVLTECTISNNTATGDGGGCRLGFAKWLGILGCKFENNHAANGGAIASVENVNIDRSVFAGNSAAQDGGAIFHQGGRAPMPLSCCLLQSNSAGGAGGAIAAHGVWTDQCTFVQNQARWGGGAFVDSTSMLDKCIFALNVATEAGPQLAGGDAMPRMSLIAVDGFEQGLYFPFSASRPTIGRELFPNAAEFIDPAGPDHDPSTWLDNNCKLNPRSPLIDASELIGAGVDLDFRPRPVEGILGRGLRADLGCYESQLTLCPTDLDADGGVSVDDFLDFLQAFEMGQPLADLTTHGMTPFPDGAVTIDDLLFFLSKFEQGC